MNAGSLSILAHKKPKNLVVILLDNGVWGSTGNTETYALNDVNLSGVAQAYGFPESNIKIISKNRMVLLLPVVLIHSWRFLQR